MQLALFFLFMAGKKGPVRLEIATWHRYKRVEHVAFGIGGVHGFSYLATCRCHVSELASYFMTSSQLDTARLFNSDFGLTLSTRCSWVRVVNFTEMFGRFYPYSIIINNLLVTTNFSKMKINLLLLLFFAIFGSNDSVDASVPSRVQDLWFL